MKRLTDRFDDGTVGVINILDKEEIIEVLHECAFTVDEASIQGAIDRLAEYEDTGLTPEEITDHEEMFKAYRHVCGGKSPDEIRNLLADRIYWKKEAVNYASELGEIKIAKEALKGGVAE